jgi:Zn-dependent membrane protease YugP
MKKQNPSLKNSMHSSLTTANDEPIAPSSIGTTEPDYDLLQHKIILTIVLCALFRTIFICLSNVTDVTGHTAGLIGLLIGASFMFNAVTIQRHFYASHKIDELMQATPVMVHNQEPNLKNSMHSSLTTANDEPIAPSSISSMEPDYDLLQHKIILTIVLCALFRTIFICLSNVTDVAGHTAGLIGLLIGASFMFNVVTIQRHFYASHKIEELIR